MLNSISPHDSFTRSADIDIPPSAAFLKVFLSAVDGDDDEYNSADASIRNIRYRDQNGVDQTVQFGYLHAAAYYGTMTHATIAMRSYHGFGNMVWTLGFWA
ncbi:MAG: hypothetical protein ACRCY8_19130 [Dermatophilaceae bacterium]